MINNPTSFIVIKCEEGLYVRRSTEYGSVVASNERLNNSKYEMIPTWHSKWMLMKGATDITSYEIKRIGERVNFRWELIDKDDNPLNLPEVLTSLEACEYESDYDWYIGKECEYFKYNSLYHRIYDTLPDTWEESPFEVDYRGTVSVNDVNNYQDMKITIHNEHNSYKNIETREIDLSSIVTYYEIDEMLTVPLAIHNRPCKITSEQTYQIIRAYVKEHIDSKYAVITSDYDFCFTVKKRIPIKPYTSRTEIKKRNGRSYVRPKFNSIDITQKDVVIFEMTDNKRKYNKYPIINGFEGDNLQDLATQIKVFLDELVERINEPLVECEHCNGYGFKLNKQQSE